MASTDVLIVGAGAAGLMCAMTAAGRGRRVRVLDHANKAGKKILMSGGGRCNFTNLYTEPANFLSRNPHFCKSALARYTQWDFIGLVAKHQVPYHEKKLGQLFCDNKSSDILEMLLRECAEAGAEILLDTSIEEIARDDAGYHLRTSAGEMRCESLVIASGGLSIPTLGASGFGYQVARQFGHEVLPTRAGLVPFTITDQLKELCAELSGTSVDCRVSCNEVTLGGVSTDEVSSKTMESQRSPGLYFVGEVLDVSGHLGGFNFQWAWASGYAAGQYA